MKIDRRSWIIIAFALILILADFIFLREQKLFYFLIGVAFVVGALPFMVSTVIDVGREKEKEEMFLEFTRSLAENVKAGTPVSKSIINLQNKDFGSLTPHIQKLGNQVALGIPVKQAFDIFAGDIGNKVVSRAVSLISEAEQAGGAIDTILDSVAKSVTEIEDIQKEQKAGVYNLVVQGYIIFVIFIVIMLVTELKIIPMTAGLAGGAQGNMNIAGFSANTSPLSAEELSRPFLELLVVQGFFTGLVIGKLSEGNTKAGLKHSFIMIALAYLITTGVRAFMG